MLSCGFAVQGDALDADCTHKRIDIMVNTGVVDNPNSKGR